VDSIASAIKANELPKIPARYFTNANKILARMLKYVVFIAVCSELIFY